MLGKNIVVFEKIYALNADGTPNYNKLLVEHTDMNDDLQTVKFQKISTELTVSDTGLHEVNTTSKDVTLQDQITYENFSKDLVDLGYYIKATAKLVDENGNAITDAEWKRNHIRIQCKEIYQRYAEKWRYHSLHTSGQCCKEICRKEVDFSG